MTNLTVPKEPAENLGGHLLLVFTNAEIAGDEEYGAWWDGGFADIQAFPGIGDGTRYMVDPDQRSGETPSWKYLSVHGFGGDAERLKELVLARATPEDSALWLYEAIGDFVTKSDGLPGSRKVKPSEIGDVETIRSDQPSHQGTRSEHVFLALTNPIHGREDDFHEWYDRYHVPDVLALDAFQSGRRFRVVATSGARSPWDYLVIYRFLGPVPQMHA